MEFFRIIFWPPFEREAIFLRNAEENLVRLKFVARDFSVGNGDAKIIYNFFTAAACDAKPEAAFREFQERIYAVA